MSSGNYTRFFNHDDEGGNIVAAGKLISKRREPGWTSSLHPLHYNLIGLIVNGEHRLAFYSTKKIKAGEELVFDYGKGYWENMKHDNSYE